MHTLLQQLLGGNIYPTKEEILDHEITHRKEVYEIVKEWKRGSWKKARTEDELTKFQALKGLIIRLAEFYDKPINVGYEADAISCYYTPITKTLVINKTLSVLSTLHEFAHHLYGHSEKQACRWSVWLFKKTFPKSYAQLSWKGHMLIRNTNTDERTDQLDTPAEGHGSGTPSSREREVESMCAEQTDPTTETSRPTGE